MPVQIENQVFQSLFDSGSGLTLMSYKAFKKLKPSPALHKSKIRLTAANGGSLHVRGYAKLMYRLGNRKVMRRTLIVDGLQTSSLIGVDTMSEENILIDHGRQRVIVKEKPVRQIGWSPKSFCILPMGQKVISLVNSNLSEGLVLTKGPLVPEGVSEVKDGKFTVEIQNNSMIPMYVPRGAEICAVRSLKPSDLEYKDPPIKQLKASSRQLPESELKTILKNVPDAYKNDYKNLLKRYSDVLTLNADEVGNATVLKHHIKLKDENAVCSQPPRRFPKHLFHIAKTYVEKLLAANVIRPSKSPFQSPLLLIRKPKTPNDENIPVVLRYRACLDYRKLNNLTVSDTYPLRNLQEMLDEVSTGKIYSCIDLAAGFYAQHLTESSKEKTAFSLPGHGLYEFNRSSMGLKNSPGAFQRLVEYCLRGLDKIFIYLDDVAIIGNTHEQHLKQLEGVFARFRKYGLKARLSKLQIGKAEINYLGHNITQHGVSPGYLKIKAIEEWKPCKDAKEVRQYLGLCSWFRRMVPHFAKISAPLTALTRKDSTWTGGVLPADALSSFKLLKSKLISRPVMAPISWDREMIVTSDGSAEGFGCMLSYLDGKGRERVVAYGSRATKPHEKKWSPFRLESSAMAFAFNHFKPYLLGKHFLARTDHKPLVNVNNVKGPGLDSVYAQLQEFDFRVTHFPGSKMPVDGLSRSAVNSNSNETKGTKHSINEIAETTELNLRWPAERIKRMQTDDKYLKSLACYLAFGLRPDSRDLQRWVKKQAQTAEFDRHGILGIREKGYFRVFAPLHIRSNLLELAHDHAGHYGSEKCYEVLKKRWTWPKMKTDILNYCRSCEKCQRVNPAANLKPVPLEPMEESKGFNDRLHIDLLGWLPRTPAGHHYLLVAIDSFSGMVSLTPIESKETDVVANALIKGWFSKWSYPRTITQDKGSEFGSNLWRSICNKLNIKQVFSSTMHPISNGTCERANRSVLTLIRKTIESNDQWGELCPHLEYSINCSPHSTKHYTPYQICTNRRPTVPSDLVLPADYSEEGAESKLSLQVKMFRAVREATKEAFLRQKQAYDKRCTQRTFKCPDIVYITRPKSGPLMQKFQEKFTGPFRILRALPHQNFDLVNLKTLKTVRCHVNRIKPGHFREQLYKETGPPVQNVQKNVRRSPRINPAAGSGSEPGLDDHEEQVARPARALPPGGPGSPVVPRTPSGSTPSLPSAAGSVQNTLPSSASSQSLQSQGESALSDGDGGASQAGGSLPSSENGKSQQDEERALSPQSHEQERLSSELQQVRQRRLEVEQELEGQPAEPGAQALPPPQPHSPPLPARRSKRKAKRPDKYFGDEFENYMIQSF